MERFLKIVNSDRLFYTVIVFILGLAIYARTAVYFADICFISDDTCVAMNILERTFSGFFRPLDYAQLSPPEFLITTKLLSVLFGPGQLTLSFIPFASSIISVFLFYFVSRKFLTNKIGILLVNYLFATHIELIYAVPHIKPYLSDLAIMLAAALLVDKLKFSELSVRRVFWYGVITAFLQLCSFPVIFAAGAVAIMNLIADRKNLKKIIVFLAPVLLTVIFVILPLNPDSGFRDYFKLHEDAFFRPSLSWVLAKFSNTFLTYPLLLFIPFCFGLVLSVKSKNPVCIFCNWVLALTVIASWLELYPCGNRTTFYLTPFILLYCAKPMDTKNILRLLCGAAIIFWAGQYGNLFFRDKLWLEPTPDIKEQIVIIKENLKDGDLVLVNQYNHANYLYYSQAIGLDTKPILLVPNYVEELNQTFKELDPKKTFWFSILDHTPDPPTQPYIHEWAGKYSLRQEYYLNKGYGNSFLMLIKVHPNN